MVFHITGIVKSCFKITFCCRLDTLNFGHDNFDGLSDDVCQHVKSATMRHADHEGVGTILDGSVNRNLEARNKRVTALKSKSLLGVEFLGHESTEVMGPLKTVVEVKFLLVSHTVELDTLEVDSDPITDNSFGNVGELDSYLTAVRCFICFNDLMQLPIFLLTHDRTLMGELDVELTLQILFCEPVLFVVEQLE